MAGAQSRRPPQSLRTHAAVRVSLLTASVITMTGIVIFFVLKGALEEQMEKRGRALAKSIGRTSELALLSARGKEAAEAVDPFFRGDDEVLYVILVDKDERPILTRVRRGYKELNQAELVRIHRAMGAGPIDVSAHLTSKVGIAGFTEIVKVRRRGVTPEILYEEDATSVPPPRLDPSRPGADVEGSDALPSGPETNDGGARASSDGGREHTASNGAARPKQRDATDDDLLPELAPPPPRAEAAPPARADPPPSAREGASREKPAREEVGRVLVGLSKAPLDARLWALAQTALGIGVASLALLLAGLFYASRRAFVRIERMVDVAYHISRGDLTRRVPVDTEDELGRLGDALNRIASSLGGMMSRVREVTGHLRRAVETLSSTSTDVVGGARVQSEAVVRTQSAVHVMTDNLRTVAADVTQLSEAARQSSVAIGEMTGLNQEVLREVAQMTRSVDATTLSIEEMAGAVREVASSAEAQSVEASRTSHSMSEMDLAIREVRKAAQDSAELSDRVRHDAEEGAEAVLRLSKGIRRIDRQGTALLEAMGRLDEKVRAIGAVLSLIDEIAEQVNLLSVNAAIIASQAGEHGKAFAVVADEIKELSDRTTGATRQIASLVTAVQAESRNAAYEVAQASANTQGGMKLTTQAEEALAKIVASASQGAAMAKTIAAASVGQAHGSEVATEAASRIAEAVRRIAEAASQQARTSNLIARGAVEMRALTQSVDRSCNAEAEASEAVSKGLGHIAEMVESLGAAQRSQSRSAEDVRQALEHIRRVAERHEEAMAVLQRAMESLSAQAKTLGTELEGFTTG